MKKNANSTFPLGDLRTLCSCPASVLGALKGWLTVLCLYSPSLQLVIPVSWARPTGRASFANTLSLRSSEIPILCILPIKLTMLPFAQRPRKDLRYNTENWANIHLLFAIWYLALFFFKALIPSWHCTAYTSSLPSLLKYMFQDVCLAFVCFIHRYIYCA